ncbi:MAG: hypothetical protein FD151_290, partial [bacterium]
MKVSYSSDEERFREEVRKWFEDNTPSDVKDQTLGGSTLEHGLMF